MKATGEVMAIERTLEASLNKAVRGMENGGRTLLWEDPDWTTNEAAIWWRIEHAHDERLWAVMAALRRGATPDEINRRSGIDRFFLDKLANILATERRLLAEPLTPDLVWLAKRQGFSDAMIASLGGHAARAGPRAARNRRYAANLQDGRHLRGRIRRGDALFLEHLRVGERGRGRRPTGRRRARQRPDPHRPGHRVRLLLRAFGLGARGRRTQRACLSTPTRKR